MFASMKLSYILYKTGAHFIDLFSIMLQILQKISVTVILFVDI